MTVRDAIVELVGEFVKLGHKWTPAQRRAYNRAIRAAQKAEREKCK